MMHGIFYVVIALAALVGLYYFGLIGEYNIAHPFWRWNSTLYGGLGGVVLTFVLFVLFALSARNPKWAGRPVMLCGLVFVVSLGAVLYYSKVFIDAAEFERMASQIWHKGSYLVTITFVVVLAHWMRRVFSRF